MAEFGPTIAYEQITVCGVVQGVGFRPFVLRTAKSLGILGYVRNEGGQVFMLACAPPDALDRFAKTLARPPMTGARVDTLKRDPASPFKSGSFVILESEATGEAGFELTADLPLCAECAREQSDSQNRRFGHAMISCASCGPRYTILESLPYDRPNTSMRGFSMCPSCEQEYADPEDRRCHAQTISCPDCGPQVSYRRGQALFPPDQAIDEAARDILGGKLVAVKGLGGYHVACLPTSEDAVGALRALKGREDKPFALMFPDIRAAEAALSISQDERSLLLSEARPIVLVGGSPSWAAPGVGAGSLCTGCFLAYTPLQHLLLQKTGPLVMTSLNISRSPILTDDREADGFRGLDGVLSHPRPILRPLDDSVMRVSRLSAHMIRRARGFVPASHAFASRDFVLALGGDLKAAFCVARSGRALLSAPHGDLDEVAARKAYRTELQETLGLFGGRPGLTVRDMHPGYYGTALAEELGGPVLAVQHHHAHIAAVMAEHRLRGPVIGVAFDGTGYGTDGTVWGGEILICNEFRSDRFAHLPPVRMPGGDMAAVDAGIPLDCCLLAAGLPTIPSRDGAASRAVVLEKALTSGVNTVTSTSAGRLFDAVSCFLGICSRNGYEGQCAIELERASVMAQMFGLRPPVLTLDTLWRELVRLRAHHPPQAMALAFHKALADWITVSCEAARAAHGLERVALAGGVFLNELLLTLAAEQLTRAGFLVFWNKEFSPGDGSLALGQAYIGSFYKEETSCASR